MLHPLFPIAIATYLLVLHVGMLLYGIISSRTRSTKPSPGPARTRRMMAAGIGYSLGAVAAAVAGYLMRPRTMFSAGATVETQGVYVAMLIVILLGVATAVYMSVPKVADTTVLASADAAARQKTLRDVSIVHAAALALAAGAGGATWFALRQGSVRQVKFA